MKLTHGKGFSPYGYEVVVEQRSANGRLMSAYHCFPVDFLISLSNPRPTLAAKIRGLRKQVRADVAAEDSTQYAPVNQSPNRRPRGVM